jgi:hypothetical protein
MMISGVQPGPAISCRGWWRVDGRRTRTAAWTRRAGTRRQPATRSGRRRRRMRKSSSRSGSSYRPVTTGSLAIPRMSKARLGGGLQAGHRLPGRDLVCGVEPARRRRCYAVGACQDESAVRAQRGTGTDAGLGLVRRVRAKDMSRRPGHHLPADRGKRTVSADGRPIDGEQVPSRRGGHLDDITVGRISPAGELAGTARRSALVPPPALRINCECARLLRACLPDRRSSG